MSIALTHANDDLASQPAKSWFKGALSSVFKKENLAYIGLGAGASMLARAGGAAIAGASASSVAATALPLTFGAAAAGGVSYYRDYKKRCAEALDNDQPKPTFVFSMEKARAEGGFFKGFDTEGLKTAGKKSLFGLFGGAALASAIEYIPETWLEKLTNTVKNIGAELFTPATAHAQEAVTHINTAEIPTGGIPTEEILTGKTLTEEIPTSGITELAAVDQTVIADPVDTVINEAAPLHEAVSPQEALSAFHDLPAGERVASLLQGAEIDNETLRFALQGDNWAIKDMAHFYANGSAGFPKDLEISAKLAMISAENGHSASIHFLRDLSRVGVDVDAIQERFAGELAQTANADLDTASLVEETKLQARVTEPPFIAPETPTALDNDVDVSVSLVETLTLDEQVNALDGLSPRAEAIKQAALNGDSQSLGDMGLGLMNERYGFPQNEALGVQLVLQAAENGNLNHRVWAAYLEYHGAEGLEANPDAALEKMREIAHPDARQFTAAWLGEPAPVEQATSRVASAAAVSASAADQAVCYVKGTTQAFNLECHNVDTSFGASSARIAMVGPDGNHLDPIFLDGVSPNATPRDMILTHVKQQIINGNWKPEDMGLSSS